jgi:carbon monoxide dehydrogenase subunit G
MKPVDGEFMVQAAPAKVLDYFADMRNVLPALPGLVEVKEATDTAGTVIINAGVSFLKGRFTVLIERTERTENGLRYRGHGDGAGNSVDFKSTLDVAAGADGTSTVKWFSEVHVHGSLASVGSGLLTPIINQNVEKFVKGLTKQFEETPVAAEPPRAARAPALWDRIRAFLANLFSSSKTGS